MQENLLYRSRFSPGLFSALRCQFASFFPPLSTILGDFFFFFFVCVCNWKTCEGRREGDAQRGVEKLGGLNAQTET